MNFHALCLISYILPFDQTINIMLLLTIDVPVAIFTYYNTKSVPNLSAFLAMKLKFYW